MRKRKEIIMAAPVTAASLIHIRFEGRSFDLPLSNLDLGMLPSDSAVKQAVAQYLELPVSRLRDYVVDRHETGNLTVRPEAVFG
jgi:hypothetical protein